jgi:hypothetical protein
MLLGSYSETNRLEEMPKNASGRDHSFQTMASFTQPSEPDVPREVRRARGCNEREREREFTSVLIRKSRMRQENVRAAAPFCMFEKKGGGGLADFGAMSTRFQKMVKSRELWFRSFTGHGELGDLVQNNWWFEKSKKRKELTFEFKILPGLTESQKKKIYSQKISSDSRTARSFNLLVLSSPFWSRKGGHEAMQRPGCYAVHYQYRF